MKLQYSIELSPLAQRQLKKMPKKLQQTLINKIETLDPNLITLNTKNLKELKTCID